MIVKREDYQGTIHVPASKSDAQRALIAGAMAGNSTIRNIGNSEDVLNLIEALRSLGAEIDLTKGAAVFSKPMAAPFSGKVIVGESGLASRLLTAVLATNAQNIVIDGKDSLRTRKVDVYSELFPVLGVQIETTNGCVPVQLNGKLFGGEIIVDGSHGSQYISGLLMALPLCERDSILRVENLKSRPYVLMTINTLKEFGISIKVMANDTFEIKGNQEYQATDYLVEGDWSAASYWIVASALGYNLQVAGLSLNSLQADKMILDVLFASGCRIKNDDDGLKVEVSNLHPFEFDASHCPDLFPALVTLAAFIPGASKIIGTDRLYNKESNRAMSLISEFSKLGLNISEERNSLIIEGKDQLSPNEIDPHGDHRIAMSIAVAGMFIEKGVSICHPEVVAKSYPEFWDDLKSLKE